VEKIFVNVIPSRNHNVHPVRTEQPRKRLLECCQLETSLAFGRDDGNLNHSAKIRTALSGIRPHWSNFYHILRVVID
jgi:hypothetical protein